VINELAKKDHAYCDTVGPVASKATVHRAVFRTNITKLIWISIKGGQVATQSSEAVAPVTVVAKSTISIQTDKFIHSMMRRHYEDPFFGNVSVSHEAPTPLSKYSLTLGKLSSFVLKSRHTRQCFCYAQGPSGANGNNVRTANLCLLKMLRMDEWRIS
jgi:hypothetical protein